jgi:hypothetical protein
MATLIDTETSHRALEEAIRNKTANIGVMGLG